MILDACESPYEELVRASVQIVYEAAKKPECAGALVAKGAPRILVRGGGGLGAQMGACSACGHRRCACVTAN
jgi:hypothetical protein